VEQITPDGKLSVAVPDQKAPGGMIVENNALYFTTSNDFADGVFSNTNGTITRFDLDTRKTDVVARGLSMPNGLVRLPDGAFLTTRVVGAPGLYRSTVGSAAPQVVRTDLGTVNGLFRRNGKIYADTTFDTTTTLHILDENNLAGPKQSIALPGFGLLNAADDLAVGPDGIVYVSYNGGGKVLRVDPVTNRSCTITTATPLLSSVRFGNGPGWDPNALYGTSFSGTIYKIAQP
jgi:sugar lactone lactonase YvrE